MKGNSFKILVDICHGEEITSFPAKLFDEDIFVSFTSINGIIDSYKNIKDQDLIIMGNPRPRNREDVLFRNIEKKVLKEYLYGGGKILLTSSSGGDYYLPSRLGSINSLYNITGVKRFQHSLIFHMDKNFYSNSKKNIRIPYENLINHPIFDYYLENDFIFLGMPGSTHLTLYIQNKPQSQETIPKVLLYTPHGTIERNLKEKQNNKIDKQALIVEKNIGKGICLSTSFSDFLRPNKIAGYNSQYGYKMLKGIIHYLIKPRLHF